MKKKTWRQIMMAVFTMLVGVLYSSSNCYAAEKTEITVNSFYQVNENTQMRENASESCERSAGTCGRRYSHGYCLYGW